MLAGEEVTLSVSAASPDGGTLSYQWYREGSAISGATNAVYTPDTGTAGTHVYYAVVTNTNNGVTGTKTAVRQSSSATVTVNDAYILRTLTDSPTGICVSGIIHSHAVLTVNDMTLGDSPACDAIRRRMNNDDDILLFDKDISLSQGFTGTLTLTIPVGTQYNGRTVTILHCASGTLRTYTATVTDGNAVFSVTSLSPFAVFIKHDSDNIPKTGDSSSPWVWWLLCGVSAMGIVVLVVLDKRRKATRR